MNSGVYERRVVLEDDEGREESKIMDKDKKKRKPGC
jgi:hypothetical protein